MGFAEIELNEILSSQHGNRGSIVDVAITETLISSYIRDGAKGCLANLPRSLADCIGCIEQFACLFVERKMVITTMGAVHMPMEVLRFEIKCKKIGQKASQ